MGGKVQLIGIKIVFLCMFCQFIVTHRLFYPDFLDKIVDKLGSLNLRLKKYCFLPKSNYLRIKSSTLEGCNKNNLNQTKYTSFINGGNNYDILLLKCDEETCS